MALERKPGEKPAATMRIVAPTETAASRSDWAGRVGALGALARPVALRRGARFLSYAVLGVLIGAVALVATATLPTFFGYHTYAINGGSMAPSLRVGSAAVAKPTSPWALEVGDIIARRGSTDGPPVLHRIVEITDVDGQRVFVTQGDQNRSPDPEPVALEGPGDKVIYSVPYAGYILNFAGSWPGRLLLIGAPLAFFTALVLRDVGRSPRQRHAASQQEPAREPKPVAPEETQFHPADRPVAIVLAAVPGFRGLMDAERALSGLAAAEGASVVGYNKGEASMELTLRAPLSPREILDALRASTGHQVLIEEARPEALRLRFIESPGRSQLVRAA